MYIILRDQDGALTEGLLLAASRNRMRVAMRDCDDTVELRLRHRHWTFPDGRIAELDAAFSGKHAHVVSLDSHVRHAA